MKSTRYSYEILKESVQKSIKWKDVYHYLGLKYNGNSGRLKRLAVAYGIDFSHFKGRGNFNHTGTHNRVTKESTLSKLKIYKDKDSTPNNTDLKSYLVRFEILKYSCSVCGIDCWMGASLALALDHIDGNNLNYCIENLRLLCPNCHSQTPTFCRAKTYKGRLPAKTNYCVDCKGRISKKSKRCQQCHLKSNGRGGRS